MVESTLKMRQTNTSMNLKQKYIANVTSYQEYVQAMGVQNQAESKYGA
jgi:hypothetical protein